MLMPLLLAWIKQRRQFAGAVPVNRANVAPFVAITQIAAPTYIVRDRSAAVLFSDDVIDFVRHDTIFLTDPTVFTAVVRAFDHFAAERGTHISHALPASLRRAFALSRVMK